MKATLRIGKGKAGHNDRSNTENNKFIDKTKIEKNKFYIINRTEKDIEFEEVKAGNNVFYNHELEKYTEYFGEALKKQNEKHLERRQKNRIKNMEDILNNEKTEPDEIVLQIGDKEKHANEKELEDCVKEFIKRINLLFGENIKLLDVGFHFDEKTPHAQFRYTLGYHDKDNNLRVGTTKALRELGIERPDKTKKTDRYNNEKITFTDIMRKHWYMIIKKHNIEIDEEVKSPSQRHLNLLEYKTQQEQQKLDEYKKQNFDAQKY